jgi:prevent-host-death family protein
VPFTTVSSREFNQDTGRAKKAAKKGPVFITDRGTPAHVLLSIEDYRKLSGSSLNIVELLGMPGVEDIAFDPPRLGEWQRPADFS